MSRHHFFGTIEQKWRWCYKNENFFNNDDDDYNNDNNNNNNNNNNSNNDNNNNDNNNNNNNNNNNDNNNNNNNYNNKPNAAGVPCCLLKNLTSDLEKWVKVTRNVNLSEIFYRYIFGINLRSLRDFVIELTRSQDFHKKWPVGLTWRSRSPESKLVRDHL